MITQVNNFLIESECKVLIEFYKHYFSQYGIKYSEGNNHLINLWELRDKFEFVNIRKRESFIVLLAQNNQFFCFLCR
jgi:hypothetical protein